MADGIIIIVATVLLSLNSTTLPVLLPTTSSSSSSSWSVVTAPTPTTNGSADLLSAVNAQLNTTDASAYSVFVGNNSGSSLRLITQTCDAALTYIDPATPDMCRLCSACSSSMYQVQPCTAYADTVCAAVCPAGSYGHVGGVQQPGAIGSCSLCAAGTFTAYAGATACAACTSNTYAAQAGSTACVSCAQGMLATARATGCVLEVRGVLRSAEWMALRYKKGVVRLTLSSREHTHRHIDFSCFRRCCS